jgi:multisubunit Na+/H+ antiporter MnhE subunit
MTIAMAATIWLTLSGSWTDSTLLGAGLLVGALAIGASLEMGDDLVVSFGKDDVSSHVAIIPRSMALSNLKSV